MGKELKRLNQNLTPLVDFQRLETNVPPLNENIYTEQQDAVRFHELLKCVANGNVPEKFISRQYPVLSENRWRTCGMRVLGLWIRKNNPSNALTILANFTTKCYGPIHMAVLLMPELQHQTYHFLSYIMVSKACLTELACLWTEDL